MTNKERTPFIKDVLEFHRTFNHPVLEVPSIPEEDRQVLRLSLLREEVQELDDALSSGDIVETADAFADIMYVLCGAILECGLGDKFEEIFNEVQRSNMSKACETEMEAIETKIHWIGEGQPCYYKLNKVTDKFNVFRDSDNKLLKSINYSPANLQRIIESTLVKDISIHFTSKEQNLEDIIIKLDNWIIKNRLSLIFDFSEPTNPTSVLHHCFLPREIVKEKGFSSAIYDILDQISQNQICWYGTTSLGLDFDRTRMLENIAKTNGISLFIGEIKKGVLEEYNYAKELGVNIIHIE